MFLQALPSLSAIRLHKRPILAQLRSYHCVFVVLSTIKHPFPSPSPLVCHPQRRISCPPWATAACCTCHFNRSAVAAVVGKMAGHQHQTHVTFLCGAINCLRMRT